MRGVKFIGGVALTALLLSAPGAAALGAAEGMLQWYASVAPALFPFLALMPLLTCPEATGVYERLLGRRMEARFNLPGAAASALAVGMLAGSPAGAMAARRVAARSGMNEGQLHRLALAAAGFSPAFLVSGVGAGMLGSAALGWKLAFAQAASQLAMARLLRQVWPDRTRPVSALPGEADAPPVRAAVLAVLGICGYMALFGAIAFALRAWAGPGVADALLCLMDVPSGARLLAGLSAPIGARLMLLAMLICFGGGCVAAQNLGALKGCGMDALEYLGMRTVAALLGGGAMALLLGLPEFALSMGRENPLAAACLCAALLSVPVLARLKKVGS